MTRIPSLVAAVLVAILPLVGHAQAGGPAGTYRAQAGDTVLLVRASDDGRILLHRADTGESATVAAVATPAGLTGLLDGQVVALGDVLGRPHLLVGGALLPLAPITLAQWQDATARRAAAATAARDASAASARGAAAALAGTTLTYAKSSNGYGQIRRFDLCPDGTMLYRFEELQSSQLGRAAGERRDDGTWSLEGDRLTVNFRSQGTRTYVVQRRSASSLSLDGTVFAVEASSRCR